MPINILRPRKHAAHARKHSEAVDATLRMAEVLKMDRQRHHCVDFFLDSTQLNDLPFLRSATEDTKAQKLQTA